jgi:hypothetical protein
LKTSEIAQSQRTTPLNKVTTYCKAKSLRHQQIRPLGTDDGHRARGPRPRDLGLLFASWEC